MIHRLMPSITKALVLDADAGVAMDKTDRLDLAS